MLALRAVIFDYGKVLTGPPDPAAYAELLRITGLSTRQPSTASIGQIVTRTTLAS